MRKSPLKVIVRFMGLIKKSVLYLGQKGLKMEEKKGKKQEDKRKFEDFPAVRTYGADLFQRNDTDTDPEEGTEEEEKKS